MRRNAILAGLIATLAAAALGAYTWTVSEDLTAGWGSSFVSYESLTNGSAGITSTTCGSIMLRYGSYAVNTILRNPQYGGTYSQFLDGTYTIDPMSSNTVNLIGQWEVDLTGTSGYLQVTSIDVSGGPRNLKASTYVSVHDSMTLRSEINNNMLGVFVDGVEVIAISGVGKSGQAGVGICSAPSGSGIYHIDIGVPETVPPNAVPYASIGISPYTSHVDLQWPASTDDPNGLGISGYQILQNGKLLTPLIQTGLTYSDTSVIPDTTYTYTLRVVDYFLNTTDTVFTVQTPVVNTSPPYPSATPEGRRVGVRTTGAYWGASPEQIDVRSNNLNMSIPLVKARGGGSWAVGFGLAYNSQNWRKDSGGNWLFDGDVGFGFGWRFLAGSITPIWNSNGTAALYYLFMDSTGAEYRLDQLNGTVWSSKDSAYVYFDASTNTLHFRDGSSWYFGCVSGPSENDSGVMYPTLLMDTNNNKVTIAYQQGSGAGWANSSARITSIADARVSPGSTTYAFTYTTGSTPPHLTAMTNNINSGETFGMTANGPVALTSPFDGTSKPSTYTLQTVGLIQGQYNFTYNGSGEMTKMTLPYGGYIAYDYATTTYPSGTMYRDVSHRYLSKDGSTQTTYTFSHEGTPSVEFHSYTILDDPGGVGEKYWAFNTTGTYAGLVSQYQGRQLPGPVALTQNDFTWAQDGVFNSYITTALTTADPGQSYQAQKEVTQTLDNYGNVTAVQTYDWGSPTVGSTVLRSYAYTYLGTSAYTSAYILNRLTTAKETQNSTQITLVTNQYDSNAGSGPGNVTSSARLNGTLTVGYDSHGNATGTLLNGLSTSITMDSTYSVPTQVTVGSLSESMQWNQALNSTQTNGPNGTGDQSNVTWQNIYQPATTISPFGQASQTPTTYTYTTTTATGVIDGRWTRTTTDGLGRTILVEHGTGATNTPAVSQTSTFYDSCGCSPLGKMTKQSLPYAPSGTPLWTVYTYDGIGRTLKVTSPDGESATRYTYQGNTVTITEPAGKWKQYTMDALGHLTQVVEPNPSTAVSNVKAIAVASGLSNSFISAYPLSSQSAASWYNSSWSNRKLITIAHQQVSGSSALTNFPIMFSAADLDLRYLANGGYVGKSDGTDILFTAADGVTKLNHELETYNASTGQVIAWVQIPSLSPTSDTLIYAYFGNAGASNQQNKTGVWDSNFKGVWHMADNSASTTVVESTSNTNTGTAAANTNTKTATGKIGSGLAFNGTSDAINIGNQTSLNVGNTFTVEAWVNPSSLANRGGIYTTRFSNASGSFQVEVGPTNLVAGSAPGTFFVETVNNTVSASQWQHIVYSKNGTTSQSIYVNGVAQSLQANSNVTLSDNTSNKYIGEGTSGGQFFVGSMDEVRISNVVRSSDWILTEYRNQSVSATFYAVGALEQNPTGPGGMVASPTFAQSGSTLTITDGTSGATIYYTTDGSTPTTSSAVYSGPVTLSSSPYTTTYAYDMLDHLYTVTMPRPSGTQTRTFSYGSPPTPFLQSANNPENGTVSYTYDSYNRLSTVLDAKNQKKVMTYDSYNRVTQVSRYYGCSGTCTEDTMQRTNFYYDAPASFDTGSYSQKVAGRLAAVQYYAGKCTTYTTPKAGCDLVQEMYTYSAAGSLLGKRIKVTRGSSSGTLTASWTYDAEGRVTNVTYPTWGSTPGSSYNYAYDTMGRLNTITNALTSASVISGITYGVANEELSMSGILNETRTYNNLFQLTRITVPSTLDIQYAYPGSTNDGKISQQADMISGEQVSYTYDALNRLASAVTADNPNPSLPQWGQSYTYDGFGNLTDQTVIKGGAPDVHVVYNASNNRQTGDTADANGNIGSGYIYDIDNRLVKPGSSSTVAYGYDGGNKRVWRGDTSQNPALDEFAFWAGSQRLATYQIGTGLSFTLTSTRVYLGGGRLIATGVYNSGGTNDKVTLTSVASDRLGSMNGKFYPYGTERPSATANDREKFTGYFRDASTGLDYADQRYEQPGVGRFMTPDPYKASSGASDPGSWNRYAYVDDDPINNVDPSGLNFLSAIWNFLRNINSYDGESGGGSFGSAGFAAPQHYQLNDDNWELAQEAQAVAIQKLYNAPAISMLQARANTLAAGVLALQALNKPSCAALFQDPNGGPDDGIPGATVVLTDILNGTGFANIAYSYSSVMNVAPTADGRLGYSIDNATYTSIGATSNPGTITINTNSLASMGFSTGSSNQNLQSAAITLLHELGHVYYDEWGHFSTAIAQDAGNPDQSKANTAMVAAACFN